VAKIVTKVRQLRLRKQLEEGRPIPLQEVANATGIERAALNRIELGRTTRIDFDTLTALCRYYRVGVGEILEYDPNGQRTLGLLEAALPSQ
jgi:putative transcriptional regulator